MSKNDYAMSSNEYVHRVFRDSFKLLCGELIGSGNRQVFIHRYNPDYVVKVCWNNPYANLVEYEYWRQVCYGKMAKWFAPCIEISRDGHVLIQQRTTARPHSEYPVHIPSFFTDTKYQNFGWIGDQFVCHDYDLLKLFNASKLTKAEWWDAAV